MIDLDRLDRLAAQALDSYVKNVGVRLAQDDNIFVWVYVDEVGEVDSVEVNTLNHQPEGIWCTVRDVANISDWWQDEWNYPAE